MRFFLLYFSILINLFLISFSKSVDFVKLRSKWISDLERHDTNILCDICPWNSENKNDEWDNNGHYILALKIHKKTLMDLETALYSISNKNSLIYGKHYTKKDTLDLDFHCSFLEIEEIIENIKSRFKGVFKRKSFFARAREDQYLNVNFLSKDRRFSSVKSTRETLKTVKNFENCIGGITMAATNYFSKNQLNELNYKKTNGEYHLNTTGYDSNNIDMDFPGSPKGQKRNYNMDEKTTGKIENKNLQLVWGPGTYGFFYDDLKAFWKLFGIENDVKNVIQWGYVEHDPQGMNFGEGTLDVQQITSFGPNVKTIFANSNNSKFLDYTFGFGESMLEFLYHLEKLCDDCLPKVVSLSLGSGSFDSCNKLCETASSLESSNFTMDECVAYMGSQFQVCQFKYQSIQDSINTQLLKLTLRGVSFLVATGDGGSHFSFQPFKTERAHRHIAETLNSVACTIQLVTFPGSSPYVTGVGGIQYPTQKEKTNDRFVYWGVDGNGGGGSGFSWDFNQPSYQKEAVDQYFSRLEEIPNQEFNRSKRIIPDISALAMGGIPIIVDGRLGPVGGTSSSAPTFAGMISMANERRIEKQLPPLGFLNPRFYSLPADAFIDVTIGNTGVYCAADQGFLATKSWDPATGFGAPNWVKLVDYLSCDE